ncbi:hypothetical protein [Aeromonas dhakensis]|uniref:hypothetical protein n=1 Tax=Aeromonas dhakensis TaxID=196024 RepID=UPI00037CEA76|nr:hypothetical protein [Aeromonas dhakensis]QKF99152.1 hypothetical protein HQK30_08015 [Aeromonas hydrophila]MDX7695607.1 hypothetical protein [Aeromonas dhakensis]MED7774381.1 hypothetical protein [Aeromonas dhakensis]UCM46762.1 hypothetical protein LEO73_08355 [Aeromonas dhakensis]WAG12597.1 hypothetical protein NRZ32_05520 [Aeromonas dhakensis]
MSNASSIKTSRKLSLSIAMTGLIALTPGLALAATPSEAPVKAAPSEQHGGKCAAGKCGTEKRFEKQALDSDPQGRLVRARDGKCGLAEQGINGETQRQESKMTEGVCGQ